MAPEETPTDLSTTMALQPAHQPLFPTGRAASGIGARDTGGAPTELGGSAEGRGNGGAAANVSRARTRGRSGGGPGATSDGS